MGQTVEMERPRVIQILLSKFLLKIGSDLFNVIKNLMTLANGWILCILTRDLKSIEIDLRR